MFQIGQMVKWSSQANASLKEKIGVIVEVVPAGSRPNRDRFLSLYRGSGVGLPRNHESYVVQVKTKIYWPRASKLMTA